jgi:hypothetical protein
VSSRDDGARDERAERAQAEEQAWREIVEHYGDLSVSPDEGPDRGLDRGLDGGVDGGVDEVDRSFGLGTPGDLDAPAVAPADPAAAPPEPSAGPDPGPGTGPGTEGTADVFRLEPYDETFVPPPLPPPPEISTDRRLAWVGLVAPPVLLLIVVVLDYPLPHVLTGALVLGFLASFGYLVATMSTEPRDPDDDGARL